MNITVISSKWFFQADFAALPIRTAEQVHFFGEKVIDHRVWGKEYIFKFAQVRDSQAMLGLVLGRPEDWVVAPSGGDEGILRWKDIQRCRLKSKGIDQHVSFQGEACWKPKASLHQSNLCSCNLKSIYILIKNCQKEFVAMASFLAFQIHFNYCHRVELLSSHITWPMTCMWVDILCSDSTICTVCVR